MRTDSYLCKLNFTFLMIYYHYIPSFLTQPSHKILRMILSRLSTYSFKEISPTNVIFLTKKQVFIVTLPFFNVVFIVSLFWVLKKKERKYNKENALPKSCIIMVWVILESDVCNPRLPPPESILSKVHSQISVKEMVFKIV